MAVVLLVGVSAVVVGLAGSGGGGHGAQTPSTVVLGDTTITGDTPLDVSAHQATLLHHHPAGALLSLNFTLPLSHRDQLNALIAQEAKSHTYLTHRQAYARFSPSEAQLRRVSGWLESSGFRITHVGADRMSLTAAATTANVEKALHVRINDYVKPGYTFEKVKVHPYVFYANTTDPTVPAGLDLQTISGLSDVDRFFTQVQLDRAAAGCDDDDSGTVNPQCLEVRSGGYFPSDLRSMYDVTGHGFDGTGQTIGFTLWTVPERQAAMTAFATATGDTPITVDSSCTATANSPTTPSSCSTAAVAPDHLMTILENGNSDTLNNFNSNVETALDIEAAHGVAPGVAMKYYASECSPDPDVGSGLATAGCNGTDVGLEDAVEDAASDPTLHSVSNSWGYGGDDEWGATDPFVTTISNSLALAAAAGTTFYFSTGDTGTYQSGFPADSPYVVSVGGTSDWSTSSTSTKSTATTWSAAGSWCSNIVARPSWQTGSGVSANAPCPGRVIPDVSAIADTSTSVRFVASSNLTGGTQAGGVGGTSVAAPVMNGLQADTENFVAGQTYPGAAPSLGFVAPTLYQLGNGGHYESYFHDIQCGNTASPTSAPDGDAAQPGWDAATGWGEPDWFNFATGYALALGATNLSVPASLATGFNWTCAKTPCNSTERGLSCPSASVCYAVGSPSGNTPWPAKFLPSGSWGAVNTFFKSTDGGVTWFPSNSDMLSIACTSSATCNEVGDGGRERRTTDGGSTWTDVPTGFDKALTSVTCPSSAVCYAVGDRGTALKSTDGGQTWSYLQSTDGNPFYGLSCPTTSVCYATDIYGHVLKTADGGSSWTWQTTPVTTPGVDVSGTGGPNPFAGLLAISCSDASTCVASGLYVVVSGQTIPSSDPPIVSTTDGGTTWTLRTSNAGTGNYLHAIACLPGTTTCYAVGRGGAIVSTTDLTTWTPMTSGTTNLLDGIYCQGGGTTFCVAVGQNGTVDTFDGTTWTATTGNGGTGTLADVSCQGNLVCYATGKQGVTLLTTTGGTMWTQQAGGGTTQQVNAVSCPATSTCYAVGNAGTILKTANGGQSWISQTSGLTTNLNGVSCFSGSGCIAVGTATATTLAAAAAAGDTNIKVASVTGLQGGQTIAIDTGASKETGTIGAVGTAGAGGTGVTLNAPLTLAHASGVAVAGSSVALRTTDGSTWNAATNPGFGSLNAVSCASATSCTAVGASGLIDASADGGATWSSQASGSAATLSAVACPGSTTCFATGSATSGTALMLRTIDGATWSPEAIGGGQNLTSLACLDTSNCFAAGAFGTVMTTTDSGATWTQQGNPLSGPVSALNASSLPINGAACNTGHCVLAAGAQGDIMLTPILTVTVDLSSPFGTTPVSSGIAANASSLSFSPAGQAGNVTGTLTCSTAATSASPVGSYPISACNGLSDPGYSVVYAYASSSDQVVAASQTITFVSPGTQTFGSADFAIDPTASSALAVSVSVTSGQCTLSSATAPANVHLTGAGSCSIKASQPGAASFAPAADVTQSFGIDKAAQTITFADPGPRTYGAPDFTVAPTASSGLGVIVSVGGSDSCTASGFTIHLTGVGSCTITAAQAGNANFNPAGSVARTIAIGKADQTISFGALPDHTFGDADFTLSASSSGGLGISFAAGAGSACTLTGASVHLTGVGSCSITASQGGDGNYNPAAGVTRSFAIAKAAQTITFAAIGNTAFGAPDFQISAGASSTLPVSFAASGKCTVKPLSAGFALVHLTAAGKCTVTASQGGDANRLAAPSVARTFTIAAFSAGKASGSALKTGNGGAASFEVDGTGGKLTGTLSWHRKKVEFDAKKVTAFALAAGGKAAWIYGIGKDGRKFTVYVADNGTQKKGAGDPDVFKLWIAGKLTAGGKLVKGDVKVTR